MKPSRQIKRIAVKDLQYAVLHSVLFGVQEMWPYVPQIGPTQF
jgi:hypothetical protein